VDAAVLREATHRLHRVATARAREDWTERTEAFERAVIQARENQKVAPV
jgi:hypothetical protein